MSNNKNQINALLETFRNDLTSVLAATNIRDPRGNPQLSASAKRLFGYKDQPKRTSKRFNQIKSQLVARGASLDAAAAIALLLEDIVQNTGVSITQLMQTLGDTVSLTNAAYVALNDIRKPESQFLRFGTNPILTRYISSTPPPPNPDELMLELIYDEFYSIDCCNDSPSSIDISPSLIVSGGVPPYQISAELIAGTGTSCSIPETVVTAEELNVLVTQTINCGADYDTCVSPTITEVLVTATDAENSSATQTMIVQTTVAICPPISPLSLSLVYSGSFVVDCCIGEPTEIDISPSLQITGGTPPYVVTASLLDGTGSSCSVSNTVISVDGENVDITQAINCNADYESCDSVTTLTSVAITVSDATSTSVTETMDVQTTVAICPPPCENFELMLTYDSEQVVSCEVTTEWQVSYEILCGVAPFSVRWLYLNQSLEATEIFEGMSVSDCGINTTFSFADGNLVVLQTLGPDEQACENPIAFNLQIEVVGADEEFIVQDFSASITRNAC